MEIFNFFKKSKQVIKGEIFKSDFKEIIFDDVSKQVLTIQQQELKQVLEYFSRVSFLWWWTAIALQLGHRKSIDFDFFTNNIIYNYYEFEKIILSLWLKIDYESRERYRWIELEKQEEIHVCINGVNFSIFNFYRTLYDDQKINIVWNNYILNWLKVASIEELACMKLYAMVTRNKWKDAIDLYFILKNTNFTLKDLFDKSEKYFLKIFRPDIVLETILSWDWNTTEKVEYIIKNPPDDTEIIDFLKKEALKLF